MERFFLFENTASEQGIWKKWTDTENSDQSESVRF